MTEALTIEKRIGRSTVKFTGSFLSTLLWALSLVLGLSCGVQAQQVVSPARDNVLLITIDDLNDWIGCLSDPADPADPNAPATHVTGQGHPQASTPQMDRLAKRGVLFTNAHCQAPICRPSRTSFLSGLRPTTTGIYSNSPKHDAKGPLKAGKEVPWLTKRFEQTGYEIFTAGKLLHGSGNAPLGGTRCFNTNQGPYPPNKLNVPADVTPAGIWDFGAYPEADEYTDWRIAKWTIEQIKAPVKPDSPPRFFALGFYNPHLPLFAPQSWYDAAPSKQDVLLGATRDGDLDDLPEIANRIHTRVSFARPAAWVLEKEERLRALTQAYLACTSAMDDSLGKVIDGLDASDRADNTWIVVLSDHGWHLGEKNHIAKQTLWTRSTRVPMIIVPPKRLTDTPRGVRCDRSVELLDVYPTLIGACNLAPEPSDERLDGLSLLPWLSDPQAEKERPAITTLYGHNHSVVGDRYRYTRYADGSEEFYDRESDPHEFENLIPQIEQRPELKSEIIKLSAFIPTQEAGQPDLILTE